MDRYSSLLRSCRLVKQKSWGITRSSQDWHPLESALLHKRTYDQRPEQSDRVGFEMKLAAAR